MIWINGSVLCARTPGALSHVEWTGTDCNLFTSHQSQCVSLAWDQPGCDALGLCPPLSAMQSTNCYQLVDSCIYRQSNPDVYRQMNKYPQTTHSSTSYSSISTLKNSATWVFSEFAQSGSIMNRTAPSRPRSEGLGLSPFAAMGVIGCTPPFSGMASLLLTLNPLMILEVSFLLVQLV